MAKQGRTVMRPNSGHITAARFVYITNEEGEIKDIRQKITEEIKKDLLLWLFDKACSTSTYGFSSLGVSQIKLIQSR